jgi:hypothetical protein
LRAILEGARLDVTTESYVSGVVSQKLTNLMRRATEFFGLRAAWLLILPLRALALADRPLTRLARVPYMCVAVIASKPVDAAEGALASSSEQPKSS